MKVKSRWVFLLRTIMNFYFNQRINFCPERKDRERETESEKKRDGERERLTDGRTDRDFTKDGVQICISFNNKHNMYTRDNIKMGRYVFLLKFYKTDRENVFRLHLFANNVLFYLQ